MSKKYEILCLISLIIITFGFSLISPVIFSCLIGMLISICETLDGKLKRRYFTLGILFISMLQYIIFEDYIFNIFFILLIIFVPKIKFMKNILSSKIFKFLGEISWGIYSFHWPLMCSIGALLIIKLQLHIGLLSSYAISCIIVFLITFVLSIIFKYTFERFSTYLLIVINKFMKLI